jgi:hypothetical protein
VTRARGAGAGEMGCSGGATGRGRAQGAAQSAVVGALPVLADRWRGCQVQRGWGRGGQILMTADEHGGLRQSMRGQQRATSRGVVQQGDTGDDVVHQWAMAPGLLTSRRASHTDRANEPAIPYLSWPTPSASGACISDRPASDPTCNHAAPHCEWVNGLLLCYLTVPSRTALPFCPALCPAVSPAMQPAARSSGSGPGINPGTAAEEWHTSSQWGSMRWQLTMRPLFACIPNAGLTAARETNKG